MLVSCPQSTVGLTMIFDSLDLQGFESESEFLGRFSIVLNLEFYLEIEAQFKSAVATFACLKSNIFVYHGMQYLPCIS